MQQITDLQCIKYVMNEMDPTERAQFEREMRSDPDILIEVECFKRTLFKMQEGKTEIEPPSEIARIVQSKARQNARKQKVFRFMNQAPVRYSAVAFLLITAFIVGISYNNNNNSSNLTQTKASQLIQTSTTAAQTNSYQQSSNPVNNSPAATWQDRQDIITIQTVNSGQVSGLDYDANASKNAKRLRLINKPVIDQPMSDEIMLTRMPRNR